MRQPPSGTVTFLFTDIESSTRRWEDDADGMTAALATHDAILRAVVDDHDGYVFATGGDGFAVAFSRAADALSAAVEAQRELRRVSSLPVRVGVHSGEAAERDGDYFGPAVNRAARLMAIAHGGQIVASNATVELVVDVLPENATLLDLGEHRLRDLARPERVLQVCHPDLERDFPPLRSLGAAPTNLPLQPTGFVGREQDLIEIAKVLDQTRVATLTGVGGVGKTRLALEVAAEAITGHRDGAWLCELASVGESEAVVEAIAGALGVQSRIGQSIEESLFDFLRSKQLLLIVDNCEHVLERVAVVVERVVRTCARVTVLATSPEGLGVAGERIVALRSLDTPDAGAPLEVVARAEAVRLFVERAADARAGFILGPDNARAVAQICERLDGIPLAIELAAARVQAMTPAEIAARLDNQFRLLRGGRRSAVERHQTLRRAIDWSYDLLSDDERCVLQRLSVFAGGCTITAAEAVAGGDDVDPLDVIDVIATLVRRSLAVADDRGATTRYRLLETIRQYAHERLEEAGEAETVQRSHADFYLALAEEAAPNLRGADQLAWIARLEPEVDNLRTALTWALDRDALDVALALVLSVCVNGIDIGYTALGWAETVAALPEIDARPLGAAVLSQATWNAVARGALDKAAELDARRREAEQTLGVAPRPADFQGPATLALFAGRLDEAVSFARQWLDLARAEGDGYETVQGLNILAAALIAEPTEASALAEEALELARALGTPSNLAMSLSIVGLFLQGDGAPDPRALGLFREAVEIGTAVGYRPAVSSALFGLGWAQAEEGDYANGLPTLVEALDNAHRDGDRFSMVGPLEVIAWHVGVLGALEAAATLHGAADRLNGDRGWFGPMAGEQVRVAAAIGALGEGRSRELQARGAAMVSAAMEGDEAVAFARAEVERVLADDGTIRR